MAMISLKFDSLESLPRKFQIDTFSVLIFVLQEMKKVLVFSKNG